MHRRSSLQTDFIGGNFGYTPKKYVVTKSGMYYTGDAWSESSDHAKIFDLEVAAIMRATALNASVKEYKTTAKRIYRNRSKAQQEIIAWVSRRNGVTVDDVVARFATRDRTAVYLNLRKIVAAGELSSTGTGKNIKYYAPKQEQAEC